MGAPFVRDIPGFILVQHLAAATLGFVGIRVVAAFSCAFCLGRRAFHVVAEGVGHRILHSPHPGSSFTSLVHLPTSYAQSAPCPAESGFGASFMEVPGPSRALGANAWH